MKKFSLLFILFFILTLSLYASYPSIGKLHKSDANYSQLQYEINEYYKRTQAGKPSIPLSIYTYKVKENDTIFSICSLLNLTYDTIVTLNGINNPDDIKTGDSLLIPNSPGVYIAEKPVTGLEEIVALRPDRGEGLYISRNGSSFPYRYISGSHLTGKERSFFLKTLFRKPLENTVVTSDFGYRIHPVLGVRHFHTGIDYRALLGTPVRSSLEGVISDTGILGNYGIYIIIKHNGGYETVYSHLNKVYVKVNDRVTSGQVIAESGNTGVSTGPHLHFEIRKGGIPLNPADFFPGE